MVTEYYCGRCGSEFTPEPCFYGGRNLCSSCRDKAHDQIQKAKRAYDQMDVEDKNSINFASAVEGHVSQREEKEVCGSCGTETSGGYYCRSCKRKMEREEEKARIRNERNREKFDRSINNLW